MGVLRYILGTDPWRHARLFGLVAASVALGLAPVHAFRVILDRVIPAGDTARLAWLFGLLVVAVVARAFVDFHQAVGAEAIRQAVIARLRAELLAHLLRVAPDFYTRNSVGQVMSRLQTDTGRLGMSVGWIFVQPVVETVTLLVYSAYLVSMRPSLFLVAVAPVPLVAAFAPSLNRRIADGSRDFTAQLGAYGGALQEVLTSVPEVQAHGTYAFEERRHGARHDRMVASFMRTTRLQAWLSALSDASRGLGPVLVFTYGALLAIRGRMAVGQVVAFASVLGALYASVDKLLKYPPQLRNAQDRFEELHEYFRVPRLFETDAAPGAEAAQEGAPAAALAMSGVRFTHEPSRPPSAPMDLSIAPGEHVCFVGPSGSGKSTALGLLAGRLRPQHGEVTVDGRAVASMDAGALARAIGFAGQTALLFAGTLRHNLVYALLRDGDGDPGAPMTFLDRAWARARGVDAGPTEALDRMLAAACDDVGFSDDLLELGLRSRAAPALAPRLLAARARLRAALDGDAALRRFDPGAWIAGGSVAENLAFAPVDEGDGAAARMDALVARCAEDGAVGPLLAAIGRAEVLRDLEFLRRTASEGPAVLARLGTTADAVAERGRLADKLAAKGVAGDGGAALDRERLGDELFRALCRYGLRAKDAPDDARARLVAARARFAGPSPEAGAAADGEPYDEARWHPALDVRANLLFGRADPANRAAAQRHAAAIRAALEGASLVDEVRRLGLDFDVGERGARLSGGQRQKVALARVLLKAPRALLLDEVTASLDQDAARRVYALLRERHRDRTVVAVTHQLAFAAGFDRVVVFEAGAVVAQGRASELAETDGVYRRLAAAEGGAAAGGGGS